MPERMDEDTERLLDMVRAWMAQDPSREIIMTLVDSKHRNVGMRSYSVHGIGQSLRHPQMDMMKKSLGDVLTISTMGPVPEDIN